jgi:hypothetical protein
MKRFNLWVASNAQSAAIVLMHGEESDMLECASTLLAAPRAIPPEADVYVLPDGDEPSSPNTTPEAENV